MEKPGKSEEVRPLEGGAKEPRSPLNQWHNTELVTDRGVVYFLKKYEPNSYEIRNEISWLTSSMLAACGTFSVPEIVDASIEKGEVRMRRVEAIDSPEGEKIIEDLVSSAVELRSLLTADNPKMRTAGVTSDRYSQYVRDFAKSKILGIRESEEFPDEIEKWIDLQAERLRVRYFSIVHRDLRFRHLLYTEAKPVLVDWEFSNISEPAQDLAKLIYDAVVNHGMDMVKTRRVVIDQYAHEARLSADEIEERVSIFLPIIPLEHLKSFIQRKPEGYQQEVLKDFAFIKTLFHEKN